MVHTRPADSASSAMETARAAQPATQENSQTLRMLLSKQSLKIGQFKVIVFKPWIDTYSYSYGSVGKTTTIWRCVLVDATNPGNYCIGEFKKTKNTPAFETFSKAKVEGSTLLLSNTFPYSKMSRRSNELQCARRYKHGFINAPKHLWNPLCCTT